VTLTATRLARPILAVLASAGLLLTMVSATLAAAAAPPTITFPVPSKVVIGGPEVSWLAALTNPADGVDIPHAQVSLVIDPHGHATASDLTLSLLPTGQPDRIVLPLADQPDGTIALTINDNEGFDLPADTSTGARFFLAAGPAAKPGPIQVTIVVKAGDGSGGGPDIATDGRTVELVKAHGPTIALSRQAVEPGGTIKVSVTGFKPGSTVKVELHSAVTPLGSIKVGSSGAGSTTVTVPSSANGGHQIVARGRTATGQAAAIAAAVQVGLPESATDTSAAAPQPSPSGSDDPRLWTAVLGGSLLTIVLLRRRLERPSATAR
jgi:hypothetical protein